MTLPSFELPLYAFVASLLSTPLAIHYARRVAMLDIPDQRRSHNDAIPRGGGVAALLALLVFLLYLYSISTAGSPDDVARTILRALLAGLLISGGIGFLDDHMEIQNRYKLLAQLLAACLLVWLVQLPASDHIPWWLLPLAVLGLVWISNLYNFMDGSHGLAAGQAIFSGLLLGWLFHSHGLWLLQQLSLLVAAVAAGFLPWNFPRPRVFMGDVFSTSLGIAFGLLILAGWWLYGLDIYLLSMVLAVFVADSTLTLFWRVKAGQKWYNPHREHAYQHLLTGKLGHQGVWLLYLMLNMLVVLPAVWLAEKGKVSPVYAAVTVYLLFSFLWYAVRRSQNENNYKTK